jgi:hypothetical protein
LVERTELIDLIEKRPGLKAKEIAKILGISTTILNRQFHADKSTFVQDANFNWSLFHKDLLRIEFQDRSWLTATDFEDDLSSYESPLETGCSAVTFVVPEGCSILSDALARLLALCNQLCEAGKSVSIDFSACLGTLSYLNRVGFFDHVSTAVIVLPQRPAMSKASVYGGKNESIVERSGSAKLNSAISRNSAHNARPWKAWHKGVFNDQEETSRPSATAFAHP